MDHRDGEDLAGVHVEEVDVDRPLGQAFADPGEREAGGSLDGDRTADGDGVVLHGAVIRS